METQIDILNQLANYKKRQVVINCYDAEDSMIWRDGFYFEFIRITEGVLRFEKEGETIYRLSLIDLPNRKVKDDFSDYYSLYNHLFNICIYFPH
ncbi:hypothetical protein BIV60_10170 [Bacillus sp. MUM 116]|nr:hypothetical protein BIV60_10170 [Bacillus sp. MUM 116]